MQGRRMERRKDEKEQTSMYKEHIHLMERK
jgi:hypothetical protein